MKNTEKCQKTKIATFLFTDAFAQAFFPIK